MLVGASLAVACLVYAGCLLAGHPDHGGWNLIAAAICAGAGVLGLLPTWLMSRNPAQPGGVVQGAAMGFLAGMLFRMAVAGGVVVVLQFVIRHPDARPLSMWIAGWYLIVLAVEVKLVSSYVLATAPALRPAAPPTLDSAPETS